MDIATINNVSSDYISRAISESTSPAIKEKNEDFNSIFQSALNMLNETNDLQNAAETEEIKFALGYSENTHDLAIAQEKANIAIQYTVAVRDKILDAYKEIINMQI